MKSFLTLLSCMVIVKIMAQCPINTQLGTTIHAFDWTQEDYEMWVHLEPFNPLTISSPFHLDNNSINENIYFLQSDIVKDNDPDDGWELLYHNFGTSSNSVPVPSMALYNRFESKIRVFNLIISTQSSFDFAILKISHENQVNIYSSSILEHFEVPMGALDNFTTSIIAASPNDFSNSRYYWLVADYTIAYDPCVCHYKSALIFQPELIRAQTTKLELNGAGAMSQIISQGKIQSNGFLPVIGIPFATDASALKNGNLAFKSASQFGTFYQKYADGLRGAPPPTPAPPFKIPAFLKEALPEAGSIIGAIDFVIGGGKSSNTAQRPMSFTSQLHFIESGTVTTANSFGGNIMATPGSDVSTTTPSIIPVYNNALGIMNILETPKVTQGYITEQTGVITQTDEAVYSAFPYYEIGEIKYVLNPASGLELDELKGAIYFKGCSSSSFIQVDHETWRTPYIPLGCLQNLQWYGAINQYTEFVNWPNPIPCDFNEAYLSVAATFKNPSLPDAEDVLYKAMYKIDINSEINRIDLIDIEDIQTEHDNYNASGLFLNIPENIEIDFADLLGGDGEYLAWNSIVITNYDDRLINSQNGNDWAVTTSDFVIFDTNDNEVAPSDYPENFTLYNIDDLCGPISEVSSEDVESFCTDIKKYDPRFSRSSVVPYERDSSSISKVNIYPNPTRAHVTLEFELNVSGQFHIVVYNILGQIALDGEIFELGIGRYGLNIESTNFLPGAYTVFMIINNDVKVVRFVKI